MLHSDEDKEAEINKFLKSFDAFEVVIEDKPMIVGRIDYAGFSGERQFEILRVNFLNFDKENIPVSDIHLVQETHRREGQRTYFRHPKRRRVLYD